MNKPEVQGNRDPCASEVSGSDEALGFVSRQEGRLAGRDSCHVTRVKASISFSDYVSPTKVRYLQITPVIITLVSISSGQL